MHYFKRQFQKYKEIILYIIFGGLTTLVNIAIYFLFSDLLGVQYLVSNIIAWVVSVLFAYVTNKVFVFESKETRLPALLREFTTFVACRLLSGGMDMLIMAGCVGALGMNDKVIKVLSNVLVILLNYIFSKLLIFRQKKS